jgi:hypothetical protein
MLTLKSRARHAALGTLSILGIVFASAIGLHAWADDAVIHSVAHTVTDDEARTA